MAQVHDPSDPRYRRELVNPAPALLARISWGAIFAGAAIAVGLTILFGLMGTAIGFGAIDPMSGAPFDGLGTGTAIWWILTSIVSLGIGGYVAGHLSGQTDRASSTAHGAAMWGVVTVVTLWMATSAIGAAVSTATSAVSAVARTSANVVGAVGGAVIPDNLDLSPQLREAREQIRSEAERILAEADIDDQTLNQAREEVATTAQNVVRNPGQLDEEVGQLVDRLFQGDDALFSPSERQQLVEALTNRAGVEPDEAEDIANRWEQQAQSAASSVETTASDIRTAAGQTSDQALGAMSAAAWYAFFASLLSLAAAVAAAGFGAPRHPYVAERME